MNTSLAKHTLSSSLITFFIACTAINPVSAQVAKFSGQCVVFIRTDAIFNQATIECKKNYVDTSAGYYDLGFVRACVRESTASDEAIRNAFNVIGQLEAQKFDSVKKTKGLAFACRQTDGLVQDMMNDAQGKAK
jgi:hypothetical protein